MLPAPSESSHMTPASDHSEPARFAVELGHLDLTDSEVEAIQNAIVKATSSAVRELGVKAAEFAQFGQFQQFKQFGQAGG